MSRRLKPKSDPFRYFKLSPEELGLPPDESRMARQGYWNVMAAVASQPHPVPLDGEHAPCI